MLLSGVAHAPSVDAISIRWVSQRNIKVMTNEPCTGLKWEGGGGGEHKKTVDESH